MRRPFLIALLLALAAPAAAAAVAVKPPARAVLAACERSVDADERRAVFEGRMRAIAGADRLQMHFVLQRRDLSSLRWSVVEVPGWREWVASDPGVAGYRYTKEIVQLAGPAAYRAVVRFRWLDGEGNVIARRGGRSRTCRQPDMRPDLRVTRIAERPADDPQLRRYVVDVRNSGRTRSAVTALELRVDGGEPASVAVPAIRGHDTRTVTLVAPRCTRSLTALADAFEEVEELDESDNAFLRRCPL